MYEHGEKEKIEAMESKLDSSAILKIILTFSQMIEIIKTLSFNWPDVLQTFYGTIASLIPSVFGQFSTECLFEFMHLEGD